MQLEHVLEGKHRGQQAHRQGNEQGEEEQHAGKVVDEATHEEEPKDRPEVLVDDTA